MNHRNRVRAFLSRDESGVPDLVCARSYHHASLLEHVVEKLQFDRGYGSESVQPESVKPAEIFCESQPYFKASRLPLAPPPSLLSLFCRSLLWRPLPSLSHSLLPCSLAPFILFPPPLLRKHWAPVCFFFTSVTSSTTSMTRTLQVSSFFEPTRHELVGCFRSETQ